MRTALILLYFLNFYLDSASGCLLINLKNPGCKCSPIIASPSDILGKLDQTKYLSHRETFTPKITVTSSCEVSVDISESTVNNFFLMIIRMEKPPIFFRRFTMAHNKSEEVNLKDLNCRQDDGKYIWHHNEVPIDEKFEMILMSDEECGCQFSVLKPNYYTNQTTVEGSCNALKLNCPNGTFWTSLIDEKMGVGGQVARLIPWDAVNAEMTCINESWYYSGYQIGNGFMICLYKLPYIGPDCRCRLLYSNSFTQKDLNDSNWPNKVKRLGILDEFANRTSSIGTVTYDNSTCTAHVECPVGSIATVTSINNKQIIISNDKPQKIQCALLPAAAALSREGDMQYWIDGVMTLDPQLNCYP